MKTHSIIALLFLTLVAYGATTIIFDGKYRKYPLSDQNGEQQPNEDYGLSSYSQEINGENSESISDVTDNFNEADNVARISEHENFNKNTETYYHAGNSNANYQNSNNHFRENNIQNKVENQLSSNSNWSYSQSERSSESFRTTDVSGEQHVFKNDATTDGSITIGQNVVNKIVALDKIIVQEHRCNENLLNVQNPLSIKKSVFKVTKHNFVSFQNAELQNLKSGHLEYLSIDFEKDKVYVECTFNKLSTNGTFKTNLAQTKVGQFVIDMNRVRSNVSSSFHKGRPVIKPTESSTATIHIVTENRQEVDAINDSINKKYRGVLENAVSIEVYNSTHKGMVALLKTEMKTPLSVNEHVTKLFDMNWTEDNINIQMSNIGGQSWKQINQKIDSMSYTRNDDGTYKIRFDFNLKGLQWTSDLVVTYDGQCAKSKALELSMNNVHIHIVVFKLRNNQECHKIEAFVQVNGLQYNLDKHFPNSAKSIVERELPGFIERSFRTYLKNSLKRDVCHNQMNNNNA